MKYKWMVLDNWNVALNLPNGVIVKSYARNILDTSVGGDYVGEHEINMGVASVFVPNLVYTDGEFKLLGESNV
jgi:hypothetical protein